MALTFFKSIIDYVNILSLRSKKKYNLRNLLCWRTVGCWLKFNQDCSWSKSFDEINFFIFFI